MGLFDLFGKSKEEEVKELRAKLKKYESIPSANQYTLPSKLPWQGQNRVRMVSHDNTHLWYYIDSVDYGTEFAVAIISWIEEDNVRYEADVAVNFAGNYVRFREEARFDKDGKEIYGTRKREDELVSMDSNPILVALANDIKQYQAYIKWYKNDKFHVIYDENHKISDLLDGWVLDVNSVSYSKKTKTLAATLQNKGEDGVHLYRVVISYKSDDIYCVEREVAVYNAEYKLYFINYKGHTHHQVEQTSSVGIVFNKYITHFYPLLPVKKGNGWRMVLSGKNSLLYDVSSVLKIEQNKATPLVVHDDKETGSRIEGSVVMDLSENSVKYAERARFENDIRKETLFDVTDDYLDSFYEPLKKDIEYVLSETEKGVDISELSENFYDLRIKSKFSHIIGMQKVKETLLKQYKYLRGLKKQNRPIPPVRMIFMGNPGAGKTALARIAAQMYQDIGLCSADNFLEVGRNDLIGKYQGHTAKNVEEMFKKAKGGVLFIDEAYSLTSEGTDTYEKEAVDTMTQLLETEKADCVVILAGYRKEMTEFLNMNPGLKSRFPTVVDFPDYTDDELAEIVLQFLENEHFTLAEGCKELIKKGVAAQKKAQGKNAGNARLARNFFNQIKENQIARSMDDDSYNNLVIEADIPTTKERDESYDLEKAFEKIIGMEAVKDEIRRLNAAVVVKQRRKQLGLNADDNQSLHMIFKGNQGTGKTSIARIIADILYHLGAIPKNILKEVAAKDFIGKYTGHTEDNVKKIFESAIGGVLFIDEAYTLAQGEKDAGYGQAAVDTLIKLTEDYRDNIIVILAGYPKEMDKLLALNPGLASRFPITVDFPDYSADELLLIAKKMYAEKEYVMDESGEAAIKERLKREKGELYFGNARAVRNIVESSIRNQGSRLIKEIGMDFTKEDAVKITAKDINGV